MMVSYAHFWNFKLRKRGLLGFEEATVLGIEIVIKDCRGVIVVDD